MSTKLDHYRERCLFLGYRHSNEIVLNIIIFVPLTFYHDRLLDISPFSLLSAYPNQRILFGLVMRPFLNPTSASRP